MLALSGCVLSDPAAIVEPASTNPEAAPAADASSFATGTADVASGDDAGDGTSPGDGAGPSSGPNGPGSEAGDAGRATDAAPANGGTEGLPTEPVIPAFNTVLLAQKSANGGLVSDETTLDTARIQAAIDACPPGRSVLLQNDGSRDAFLTGPLHLAAGVTLVIGSGTTVFASRNPRDFDVSPGSCGTASGNNNNGCQPLVLVDGSGSGIMGDGRIDGRGGEPMAGANGQTWWDVANAALTNGQKYSNPTLVEATTAQQFTLYRVSLVNAPKFHAVIGGRGLVVWGVTVLAPAASTNSAGAPLTPRYAVNTDGIDFNGASEGFAVYNKISVGGDHIALKGNSHGTVRNMVVAHNRFGAGHGLAIMETYCGVSDVSVYDLSIDGTVGDLDPSARAGIRISSDPKVVTLVTGVSFRSVCLRALANPISIDARTIGTGSGVANFASVTISGLHSGGGAVSPTVTLHGFDSSNRLGITLDNVVVDGLADSGVDAAHANVTLGPGGTNLSVSGHDVIIHDNVVAPPQPLACDANWVPF